MEENLIYLKRKVELNKLDNENYLTIFDTAYKILMGNTVIEKLDKTRCFFFINDKIVLEKEYEDIYISFNDIWLPIRKLMINETMDFNERTDIINKMNSLFKIYLSDLFKIDLNDIHINFPCINTLTIWEIKFR